MSKRAKNISKITGIVAVVLLAVAAALVLFAPDFVFAQSQTKFTSDNFDGGFGGAILALMATLLLAIINALGSYVLLPLINLVVQIFSYNGFLGSKAVEVGWPLVRDVCNMFFVVILLLIAFSTILGYSNYHYKSALPRLILMAVVINFSKTIMGFMIDFGQVIMLTFVNAFQGAAANNLVNAFGLTEMLKIEERPTGDKINNWEVFASLLLGIVLMVVAIGTMLAYAAVLLYRIISLWVLVILSPAAFLLSAFQGGSKYAGEFWSNFWSQLTTGVIMAFFMWLSLSILSASYSATATDTKNNLAGQVGLGAGYTADAGQTKAFTGQQNAGTGGVQQWDRLYTFVIAIALLLLALQYAQKAGGFAGKFAGGVQARLGKMGSGAVKRFTGYRWASDRVKGVMALREQVRKEKIAKFAGGLEQNLGAFRKWRGEKLDQAVFNPMRKKIMGATKYDEYKKKQDALKSRQEALEKSGEARSDAKKVEQRINKARQEFEDNGGKPDDFNETDDYKTLRQKANEYRLNAMRLEQEHGLVESTMSPEDLIRQRDETEARYDKAADGSAEQEQLGQEYQILREKVVQADKAEDQTEEAKTLRQEAAKETDETKKAEKLKQAEAIELGADRIFEDNGLRSRVTSESLRQELDQTAKIFLEDTKSGSLFKATTFYWDKKAEVADQMLSQAQAAGDKDKVTAYAEKSKHYKTMRAMVGAGTTALAVGASLGTGVVLAATGMPIWLGAAPLMPKFLSWQSKRMASEGAKHERMGKAWELAEIRKRMDDHKLLDDVSVERIVADPLVDKYEKIAAIFSKLERNNYGPGDVQMIRNITDGLGIDDKTKAYREKLIADKFASEADPELLKAFSLKNQIELGLLKVGPGASPPSALRAGKGWDNVALQIALHSTFGMWGEATKRAGKAGRDALAESMEKAFAEIKADGGFDDPAKWGDLSKLITRYFFDIKKDSHFEKILMDDKGNIKHHGLYDAIADSKDFENVMGQTRTDKIKSTYGEEALELFYGNALLSSRPEYIVNSLVIGADSDAPIKTCRSGDLQFYASLMDKTTHKVDSAQLQALIRKTLTSRGINIETTAGQTAEQKLTATYKTLLGNLIDQANSTASSLNRVGYDLNAFKTKGVSNAQE